MIARNSIVCMDALELLGALPDGSVDLIVTSPPYNMRATTNGAKLCGLHAGNWSSSVLLNSGYTTHSDDMPYPEYVSWQREVITESMRVLNDQGAIFYNHKWRIQSGILEDRREIVEGFPVRQIIIWNRGSGLNHNPAFFAPQYEVLYLIAKRRFYIRQEATKYGDVWNIPPEVGNEHPAPYPIELPLRCIASTTARLIVDPFCGSGTTLLAAKSLGRDYIGGDSDPHWARKARARVAEPFTAIDATDDDVSDLPLFASLAAGAEL